MSGSDVQSGQSVNVPWMYDGSAMPQQPARFSHDAATLPVSKPDVRGHASSPIPPSPNPRPSFLARVFAVHAKLIAIGLVILALCTGLALGGGVALGQSLSHWASGTTALMPATNGINQPLPATWRASGRTAVEAGEAMAVAATFVQRYETLDARSLTQTLAAAEFVLTPNARARFLGQTPNVVPDPRVSTAFAAQIQQEHRYQAAIVTDEHIIAAETLQGQFFADVLVSYQLRIVLSGRQVQNPASQHMVVLLVAAPFGDNVVGGIGWLVSNWQDGTTLPIVPSQP